MLTFTDWDNKIYWHLKESTIKGWSLLPFLGLKACIQIYNKITKVDTNRYHTFQNDYTTLCQDSHASQKNININTNYRVNKIITFNSEDLQFKLHYIIFTSFYILHKYSQQHKCDEQNNRVIKITTTHSIHLKYIITKLHPLMF